MFLVCNCSSKVNHCVKTILKKLKKIIKPLRNRVFSGGLLIKNDTTTRLEHGKSRAEFSVSLLPRRFYSQN